MDFLHRLCYNQAVFEERHLLTKTREKGQGDSEMTMVDGKGTKFARIEKVIAVLLILVCLCGIGTSIGMNMVNRSLWLDEAMLADSFSNRTLANLWDGAFDNNQLAPLGWLYFEKILTVIFGNTEFVLRLGSVIAYTLTIGLLYYVVRKMLHGSVILSLAAAAFFANLPYALTYSNVFKQYITEGLFILIALIAFDLFRKGRIKTLVLCLIWAVSIWFSNPVCFIEGGCLIVEGIYALKEKDRKKLLRIILIGVCILSSFLVHYFFWLRQVATSADMQGGWDMNAFLLLPHTGSQLIHDARMIHDVYLSFDRTEIIMLVLSAVAVVLAFIQHRNHILFWIMAGCVMAVLASSVHFFPMAPRIWFFFIPTMIVFCFGGIADLTEVMRRKGMNGILTGAVHTVLPIVLVVLAAGMINYWTNPEYVYWQGEETNDQVDWLRENIQSDEDVYVYYLTRFGYQYRNGYKNNSIGGYPDNLIYGDTYFLEESDCGEEVRAVLDHDKIYIATSHLLDAENRLKQLLDGIRREGHLQLVLYKHSTPLFWYCRNPEDGRIRASWEIVSSEPENGQQKTRLRVYNTGSAYINHMLENVYLTNKTRDFTVPVPKLIAPDTVIETEVPFEVGNDSELILVNDEGMICSEEQFTRRQ